eukprot:jgi/Bigna1/66882/fgenesh1_pg.2_\
MATLDTFKLVRDHLIYNRKVTEMQRKLASTEKKGDALRKYIVRIILMVPAYSISAMVVPYSSNTNFVHHVERAKNPRKEGGLLYKESNIYFDTVRECYEAFVIYSFLQFLVNFLGGEDMLCDHLERSMKVQRHVFPFCNLTTWEMGREFFEKVRLGTIQYVIIRPVLAWICFVLYQNDMYGAGEFRLDRGYLWVTLITNMSQVWAMYCLALFYMALKDELAPLRPVGKFMVVKAVVFFTWWQSVVLAVLVRYEWIHRNGAFSVEDVVNGTQNFLICLEMLAAAMAHRYTFPVKDFRQLFSDPNSTNSTVKSIFDAVNVTDVFVRDVWEAGSTLKSS